MHPVKSMVRNIGHDGTGLHCNNTDVFNVELATKPCNYFETNILECALALERTKKFFLSTKLSILPRLKKLINRSIANVIPRRF